MKITTAILALPIILLTACSDAPTPGPAPTNEMSLVRSGVGQVVGVDNLQVELNGGTTIWDVEFLSFTSFDGALSEQETAHNTFVEAQAAHLALHAAVANLEAADLVGQIDTFDYMELVVAYRQGWVAQFNTPHYFYYASHVFENAYPVSSIDTSRPVKGSTGIGYQGPDVILTRWTQVD